MKKDIRKSAKEWLKLLLWISFVVIFIYILLEIKGIYR